jgi:hypothetical protein
MGSVASRCVSIASAGRVREGILVALGRHFSGNQNVSTQSARSWLTACFQRYDEVRCNFRDKLPVDLFFLVRSVDR